MSEQSHCQSKWILGEAPSLKQLYIGLMSGTSLDGVDVALVSFNDDPRQTELIATHLEEIPSSLKQHALEITQSATPPNLQTIAVLDNEFGHLFAQSVLKLLEKTDIKPSAITAIGSHGQTLWHHPHAPYPYTLQVGDPNLIAQKTGITTICDFRRGDITQGGQGAPLAPAFHKWFFTENKSQIILNIGGIANISLLPFENEPYLGFDTGPGNGLMDAWCAKHQGQPFDQNGNWAKQGSCHQPLLNKLLNDPYFQKLPPKSTGKDYFNLNWLENALSSFSLSALDIQATLLALTTTSISDAIRLYREAGEVIICGGGSRNFTLLYSLTQSLGMSFTVTTTEDYGIDPDWIEAVCFAWLAKQRLENNPIDLTAITGAKKPTILGGIWSP